MKRLLLVLGAVLSIAGASGLAVYGRAIVGVLTDVLVYRVVNPPLPLPSSIVQLGWVAASGVALAFGLVVVCTGTVMRDGQRTMLPRGKVLLVVAGILFLLGAMSLLTGIVGAKAGFRVIATSAMTPKPEEAREMYRNASPAFTVGSSILVAGAVVLLVAGQVGFKAKPPQANKSPLMLGVIATVATLVLAFVSSLLFVGILSHGAALGAILTTSVATPKPSELAEHLAGILDKSMLAFISVGCQGALFLLAALFTPSSGSESISEGIE